MFIKNIVDQPLLCLALYDIIGTKTGQFVSHRDYEALEVFSHTLENVEKIHKILFKVYE